MHREGQQSDRPRFQSSWSSSCVKIYLCSNPEDSVVERRALRETVFPRFREHCRRTLGLDVRVIDPFESRDSSRWPDENTRQQLIKECRESSAGPFLLALIGHQYGRSGLPAQVEVSEYQLLLQGSQQAGVSTKELERAYRRDENAIPASYCLRPPIRPFCDPPESTVEGKESKDAEVRKVFESAVALCVHAGLLSPQRGQSYYRSVLDADLRFALDDCPEDNMAGRCLVYVNHVVNARGGKAKQQLQAESEAETSSGGSQAAVPSRSDSLLSELCDGLLPRAVTARHLAVYTTTTECDPRHGYTTTRRRGYSESLCQQVYCDLVELIDSLNVPEIRADALTQEQAEQEELCDVLSPLYEVIQPEEEQIRVYVVQKDPQCPLVVTGGPCTGKTVMVAHCSQQMKSWLSDVDPVVISYFCNLSTDTSPEHLLSCLCFQITRTYQESPSEQEPGAFLLSHPEDPGCVSNTSGLTSSCCPTSALDSHHESSTPGAGAGLPTGHLKPDISLSELKEHLWSLLTLLASSKRPLVMLLDGLDQLETTSGLQIIHSLPSPLPPNVKLILTASSHRTSLLQTIQLHYPQRSPAQSGFEDSGLKCVQLGPADRKQCVSMLASLLGRSGRKVTSGQQALVNQALTSCRLPLYCRLLHAHTSLWHSDSDVSASSLPDGVHSSISALLDRLQDKHGSSVVARAVSCLSLSRAGLTEAELADLLSCGDRAEHAGRCEGSRGETEVSQVDVEGLLLDLKSFVVNRTAAGSRVLQWVSRHFKLVVAKRFLGSEEVRRSIHKEIADYFSGGQACAMDKNSAPNRQMDKQPSSRPLVFRVPADAGQVSLRRLVELPYHLKLSGRWEDLERGLLMSFIFHQAMVQAGLLLHLVAMLESEEGSTQFLRERLLLASVLRFSACLLQSRPLQLPSAMEAGLLPYLEVFPALQGYTRDIKRERRRRGSVLGLLLCPCPSSVLPIRRFKQDNHTAGVCVTEMACTECGVVAGVMSDGTAWTLKGCGCDVAKLSLSREENELKFAGVKASGGSLVLSTRCNKVFVCDVTGSETLQEIEDPLRTKSEASKIQEFVACQRKLVLRWEDERFVSVFDVSTETLTHFQCPSSVTCLAVSSDSVCCGQEDGAVSIFDIETSALLGTCSNHSAVLSLILCEDKCACVDRTGSIALWDVTAKTPPPRLMKEIFNQGNSSEILNTDYSHEMETLLLCQADRVTLYDTCEWELWDQFMAPQKITFTQAVLSQDGHHFLALLEACTLVLVWRITSGECVISLEMPQQPHTLLKTATDVICVAHDGCMTVWDWEMIAAAGTTPKMKHGVKEVAVEPAGRWFYTADGSERVWRWSVDAGLPIAHFLHDGPVEKVQLSPDSIHLVSLSAGDIYVWRTETGENVVRISGSRVSDILITPNGKFGVSMSQRGLSRVWKMANGGIVCSINLYLSNAQVSPEGTFLIGHRRGDLLAASLWSGSISSSCALGSERVVAFHTLAQHPDFVLVMAASGAVYTWKVAEGTVCRHFQLPLAFPCRPHHFQMSSDGSFALLSTDNCTVSLLDMSQVRLCSFNTEGPVVKACLDKNGRFAAYISDPSSNNCTCSLHMRPVLAVARLSNGEIIGRVSLPKSPLTLAVSGQHVFVGLADGSVGVYSVSNVTVSEDVVERNREGSSGHADQCPFDRGVTCWFPQATATVAWP